MGNRFKNNSLKPKLMAALATVGQPNYFAGDPGFSRQSVGTLLAIEKELKGSWISSAIHTFLTDQAETVVQGILAKAEPIGELGKYLSYMLDLGPAPMVSALAALQLNKPAYHNLFGKHPLASYRHLARFVDTENGALNELLFGRFTSDGFGELDKEKQFLFRTSAWLCKHLCRIGRGEFSQNLADHLASRCDREDLTIPGTANQNELSQIALVAAYCGQDIRPNYIEAARPWVTQILQDEGIEADRVADGLYHLIRLEDAATLVDTGLIAERLNKLSDQAMSASEDNSRGALRCCEIWLRIAGISWFVVPHAIDRKVYRKFWLRHSHMAGQLANLWAAGRKSRRESYSLRTDVMFWSGWYVVAAVTEPPIRFDRDLLEEVLARWRPSTNGDVPAEMACKNDVRAWLERAVADEGVINQRSA